MLLFMGQNFCLVELENHLPYNPHKTCSVDKELAAQIPLGYELER